MTNPTARSSHLPWTLVAASSLWLAGVLDAQAETLDDAPTIDEEIVVTGSRIRQDPLDARESILDIDTRDRDRTGLTSLGDMLGRLPVSGSSLNTRFNSSGNFGFPADGGGVAAGASQVDLRHLGAKRVLVLVDGLRWIHGSSGSGVSGATDLNTIPEGVVDRVEILRDGASALYGSDAIAGVVNIVTRSTSGLRGRVYAGSHVHGGETVDVEFGAGGKRGRTSASVSVDYTDQQRISAADHEQTRWPKPGTGVTHGSTFTPQGRIIVVDPNTGGFVNCALNDDVVGVPVYDPARPCGRDDYHPWSNADRFNYSPYNLTLTPSRRVGSFARIEHAIADNVRLFARLVVNRRESVNQAAPEPVWAGTLAETGSVMDEIVIDTANPYNPFGFDVGPGAFATRRLIESGPRIFRQDVATRYLATGLQGEWTASARTFYWDANVVWSHNEAEQTKHGAHNARKMLQALGPPAECARVPGCVPLNLLGGLGTITPGMLDWIGFVQRDSSAQKLGSFTFNVTGDLMDLRAGPLAFAAGVEQRSQAGRFDPDPVVAAGDTAGLPAQPTAGALDVAALYGEVAVPLVADAPWGDLVDLSAAVRYFHYTSFDSGVTGKVGVRWRPISALLLRASWAEGYRAPSIGELFGGLTRLDAVIADPCASFLATNVGRTVVDNCIAAGVPGDGSYSQLGGQISVLTGGNESLVAETSTSSTFALTWQPLEANDLGLVDDARLELVHYAHRVDDAITGYDAQAVLDGCYRTGVTALCQLVERNARGGIARFRNTLFNVGSIRTAGWDLGVLVAGRAGWRLNWRTTYVDEYRELLRDARGTVIEERSLVGQTQGDQGKPAWKSNLTVDWQIVRWRLSWTVRYIHAITERCSDFLDGSPASLTNLDLCSMPDRRDNTASRNRLGTTVYHDGQLGYESALPRGTLRLSLGLNNAFDRDPPPSQSAPINGYDPSLYDMPGGRLGYLRVAFITP